MYLAGALVDLSPAVKGVSLADSRFAAFLTNSAPATATADGSPSGFSSTSWTSISKPAMQQTGSGDEPGRRVVYDVMRPGDKFLSFFDSPLVTHQSFFFLDLAPPEFAPLIVTNGMAFFDAYLRGSAEAKAWLTTNQLSRGTNGVAQISNK